MRKRKKGCGCFFGMLLMILFIGFVAWWGLSNSDEIIKFFYPRTYEEMVAADCEEYGVDKWLAMALIREESDFDPDAVSAVGAHGLMQLMPETADWLIKKGGFNMDAVLAVDDEEDNILLGVYYLSLLEDYYSSSSCGATYAVMIAAYNAGIGAVDGWLADGTWDGRAETAESIPYAETRKHVVSVLRSYDEYCRLYQ